MIGCVKTIRTLKTLNHILVPGCPPLSILLIHLSPQMPGATETNASSQPSDAEETLERQSASNKPAISPSDDALLAALTPLRSANPAMGASKLHAKLLQYHPEWVGGVSEKRTRRILTNAGLVAQANGVKNGTKPKVDTNGKRFPTSHMLENFDVSRWTDKVAVHDFGPERGKGLVATKEIAEGEVVWKEDPWIIAPEWSVYTYLIPLPQTYSPHI